MHLGFCRVYEFNSKAHPFPESFFDRAECRNCCQICQVMWIGQPGYWIVPTTFHNMLLLLGAENFVMIGTYWPGEEGNILTVIQKELKIFHYLHRLLNLQGNVGYTMSLASIFWTDSVQISWKEIQNIMNLNTLVKSLKICNL